MLKLADNLKMPADFAGRRTAVFGISGSGKSNTATVVIEELVAAGDQVVLVDPKGEGWGLLSSANGKPSGLDVIVFGEPHGHITALTEHHGPQLADFVVESGRSVVLSLTGFPSDESERRFVALFLRQLYRRKSQAAKRTRTLVVLDEAHLFVPESAGRGFKGEAAELAGACQRIVRQGRSFGVGSLIVDQRPQDVAKRVVTQCDTVICHQLTHALDRDALAEWVRGHDRGSKGKEFLDSLAALQPGEAWVWSPTADVFRKVQIRRRRTFDSGAAPDGKAAVKVQRADVDLAKLGKQLDQLVAKSKADDPKELKRRIADLERQLKGPGPVGTKHHVAIDHKAVERAVAARDREWRSLAAGWKSRDSILLGRVEKAAALLSSANGLPEFEMAPTPPAQPVTTPVVAARPAETGGEICARYSKSHASPSDSADGITPRQQRFLDTAATLTTLGVEVSRETVCGWLGVHPRGGSVGEELKALADAGLIALDRGRLRVTEAGHAASNAVDPSGAIEQAKSGLTDRQSRFFSVIVEAYPDGVTREAIAKAFELHPRGGSLGEDLGRLVSRGLVERRGGKYTARDFLFAS